MSYNIRNYGLNLSNPIVGDRLILDYIDKTRPDIISLQEINNKQKFIKSIISQFPYFSYAFSNYGGSGRQHLGVVYDHRVFKQLRTIEVGITEGKEIDNLRPLFIVELQEKKPPYQKFAIASIHLKAGGNQHSFMIRDAQHEIIKKLIKEFRSKLGMENFILSGDFNSTEYRFKKERFHKFNQFVDDTGLEDEGAEELSCTAYYYKSGKLTPSTLDHILIDRSLAEGYSYQLRYDLHGVCKQFRCHHISKNTSKKDLEGYYQASDHCPVTLTVGIN